LFDVGHHEGVDFLVLEYLEGQTLADRLKKGPLPIAQALEYAIQIASALERAQAGIPRLLFPGSSNAMSGGWRYAISHDGQRFLAALDPDTPAAKTPDMVVLN
jgi:hypothetical protein